MKPEEKAKSNIVLGNAVVQGQRVTVSITLPIVEGQAQSCADGDTGPPLVGPDAARATHAPDFSSVNWYGTVYTFTPAQRPVIALLWEANEDGYRHVSQDALLQEAESDCDRLRSLFSNSPAWGKLVVKSSLHGGRAGQYCFALPPKA